MAAQTAGFTFTDLDGRVYDPPSLAKFSTQQLLALPGVGWPRFRLIVRELHGAGLNLTDLPQPTDSLESLPLGPLGSMPYRVLRATKFNARAVPGARVTCIHDLTLLDHVAVRRTFQSNLRSEIVRLRALLWERGLDFAPLYPTRTINDVAPGLAGALGGRWFPAKTLVTDITMDRLAELHRAHYGDGGLITKLQVVLVSYGHLRVEPVSARTIPLTA